MKQVLYWLPVSLGLVFLLTMAYVQRERALRAQNDFVQFYVGAKLAGTPDLYSRKANLEMVNSILGFTMETVVYTRPPFYAALLKPLSFFPYLTAYALFSLATFASILWFVIRFTKECSALPLFASLSLPAVMALCAGQDTPFLLVGLGVSILLGRRNQDFLAGLILSLCAIKFHLFLFLPLLWLVTKRWRILGGAACGTAVLTALGVLLTGADSIRQYVNVLRDPFINPNASGMPNLHGLIAILQWPAWTELLLVGILLLAFVWMTQKTDNYELLFAASLVCSLLVSYHSGFMDDLILLPVMVLVLASCQNVPTRAASALILTPVPYFMAVVGPPYSVALPLALLLLLGMLFYCAVWAEQPKRRRTTPDQPAELVAPESACR